MMLDQQGPKQEPPMAPRPAPRAIISLLAGGMTWNLTHDANLATSVAGLVLALLTPAS